MIKNERRRHERFGLPYKIVLNLQNEMVEGRLKDISACGASCYIDKKQYNKEISLGTFVTFALASDTSFLKFEGTIVRVDEEGELKLLGITFY